MAARDLAAFVEEEEEKATAAGGGGADTTQTAVPASSSPRGKGRAAKKEKEMVPKKEKEMVLEAIGLDRRVGHGCLQPGCDSFALLAMISLLLAEY